MFVDWTDKEVNLVVEIDSELGDWEGKTYKFKNTQPFNFIFE